LIADPIGVGRAAVLDADKVVAQRIQGCWSANIRCDRGAGVERDEAVLEIDDAGAEKKTAALITRRPVAGDGHVVNGELSWVRLEVNSTSQIHRGIAIDCDVR